MPHEYEYDNSDANLRPVNAEVFEVHVHDFDPEGNVKIHITCLDGREYKGHLLNGDRERLIAALTPPKRDGK